MYFSHAAILAFSSLAAAKSADEWASEFETIPESDAAAFSSWRDGYRGAFQTEVAEHFQDYGSENGLSPEEITSYQSEFLERSGQGNTQDYSYYSDLLNTGTVEGFEGEYIGDYYTGSVGANGANSTGGTNGRNGLDDDFSNRIGGSGRNSTIRDGDDMADLSLTGLFPAETGRDEWESPRTQPSGGFNVTSTPSSRTDNGSIPSETGSSSSRSDRASRPVSGNTSRNATGDLGNSSSSTRTSTSVGVAVQQAPMIVGVAFAGLSVLMLSF